MWLNISEEIFVIDVLTGRIDEGREKEEKKKEENKKQ